MITESMFLNEIYNKLEIEEILVNAIIHSDVAQIEIIRDSVDILNEKNRNDDYMPIFRMARRALAILNPSM
jgi:hypothetical protein